MLAWKAANEPPHYEQLGFVMLQYFAAVECRLLLREVCRFCDCFFTFLCSEFVKIGVVIEELSAGFGF